MNNVKISAFNIVVSNNLNCVQKYMTKTMVLKF